MCESRWSAKVVAVAIAMTAAFPAMTKAETLASALVLAYRNNAQLNSERARVRATDESVPQALSGYRPTITATASVGEQYLKSVPVPGFSIPFEGSTVPTTLGVTAQQTLFNGFRTGNRVRAAESQVSSDREALRMIEQQVLLDGATQYMNVLRDGAILELNRRNVEVLEEQLRQTRDRFQVGEVTRTDVAQAESRLAAARSASLAAQATLVASQAAYRRVIGVEPNHLAAGAPVDQLSPHALGGAIARGLVENPQITAQMYGVDVRLLQVKIAEGALYPTLTLQASVQDQENSSPISQRTQSASVVTQLSIPIYQGGQEYSLIRQSKETLGQQRLTLEFQRDQVRQGVVQAWGQLTAAKAQIQASQAQVAAAEIALNGVREEARVGQRTTLDVLNAQQELVQARVNLVTAQRDRVVASYTLLAATGRLSPRALHLPTEVYDTGVHYHQVRDAWFGVRVPDGR
jgi:outer membrane protein